MLARILPPPRITRIMTAHRDARGRAWQGRTTAAVMLLVAGCGSTTAVGDLPPAAGPAASPPLDERPAGRVVAVGNAPEGVAAFPPAVSAAVDGGRATAVLSPRERVLEIFDRRTRERLGRIPAGAGPTHVAAGSQGRVYVVDTAGDGLLVFETRPELRLTRRLALLGGPYGIAVDRVRGRLWVTLTHANEVVELAAGARPHLLRTFPAVRQPDAVAVDPASGRVFVTGKADGVLQLLDPRRSR
jgi:DNA-binding beta-propeller fold protein YncE